MYFCPLPLKDMTNLLILVECTFLFSTVNSSYLITPLFYLHEQNQSDYFTFPNISFNLKSFFINLTVLRFFSKIDLLQTFFFK